MAEQRGKRARTEAEEKLEVLLKGWGREFYNDEYREQQTRRRWEPLTASHPIAQSMQFGAGKRVTKATHQVVGRGGLFRRRLMGAAAGRVTAKGTVLPVPMYAVDPVPCKERRGSGRVGSVNAVPPHLSKVEQAVNRLSTDTSYLRALCVRVHYADLDAKQEDKVPRVNEHIRKVSKGHPGIDLNRFRDELTFARVWLGGALAELMAKAA